MITDRLVKKINKLATITDNSIQLMLSNSHQLELEKGQQLLKEGQICKYLYFVEKGFLRTYHIQDGEEINVNFTFEEGITSDFKSLKTNQPSPYSIVAGEKSLVTLFNKDEISKEYANSKELELLCKKLLDSIVIDNHEQMEFLKINKPSDRYRYLIKNNPQMVQRISVSHLSSYIGVARETLSRIRKNIV